MSSLTTWQQNDLLELRKTAEEEFTQGILPFWYRHTIDRKYGGFTGRIDSDAVCDPKACKGLMLNAGILWTFSSAWSLFHQDESLEMASRAYNFLFKYFSDNQCGGFYEMLNYDGTPCITDKIVGSQAAVIHALAEYHLATGDERALNTAIDLFRLLEQHSSLCKGYPRVFACAWKPDEIVPPDTARQSDKKKTVNSFLHILEGYITLYRAWPDSVLKERLLNLLTLFLDHFIDPNDHHLRLQFDEDWTLQSGRISCGYDMAGSWLLREAAGITGEQVFIQKTKEHALAISGAVLLVLNPLGGLCSETSRDHPSGKGEMEWWTQAEAVVGFLDAWEASGRAEFLHAALTITRFIRTYFLDMINGEWFYRLSPDGEPLPGYDKVGSLKSPLHNARMCFELVKRISRMV